MGALGPFPLNFHSAQDLLSAFYGSNIITLPHEKDFTVGTSIVTLDPARGLQAISVAISNTGTPNIFVSFNSAMASPNGFLLQTGGFLSFDWYYDGDLVQKPLYAIGAAGGGTLHVLWRMLTGA